MYHHCDLSGEVLTLPVGKVVCVGSNYQRHIQEMGSATPVEPVLFIKPSTALCALSSPLTLPTQFGVVHHEVELAILIASPLTDASEAEVSQAIAGYAVALDLTLRDLQAACKKSGQPWDKAKGFDNACPISGFIAADKIAFDPQAVDLQLVVNGIVRQQGNTRDMIHRIIPLISYMSRFFTLQPGDIVLTGTPEGVGPLLAGDQLAVTFADHIFSTRVN
ncbi:MAG: putative protein YcgM [Candidatus Erwinia impunctatus]|nr:putative protein YcgM [Culicoides impunctatus]